MESRRTSSTRGRSLRIGFLFNHDHIHQVAHSAPIAFELVRSFHDVEVELLVATDALSNAVRALAGEVLPPRCMIDRLNAHGPLAWIDPLIGRWLSFRRLAVLEPNAARLDAFDALVVPEKTTLRLRTHYGCKHVKLIHTRHGAGDRAVGFDPESAGFDLTLLSGEKIRQRLAAAHALPPRWAIVGYPKFDTLSSAPLPKLFARERKTVVYNPHFSPHFSSWFDMGRDVLEFFASSREYNLIFAPHVMLFRRPIQLSVEKLGLRIAPSVPRKFRGLDNVLIDLGSERSTDMTYTRVADVYLGDVSSQVCEFVVEPRPCVFANPRRVPWEGDPSYAMWNLGPVFERIDELPAALERAEKEHPQVRALQESYVRASFDLTSEPSSRRAARAIYEFLRGSPGPSSSAR